MGQVECTLTATSRRRQRLKRRDDLKGADVVTRGADCRKLCAGNGEESC